MARNRQGGGLDNQQHSKKQANNIARDRQGSGLDNQHGKKETGPWAGQPTRQETQGGGLDGCRGLEINSTVRYRPTTSQEKARFATPPHPPPFSAWTLQVTAIGSILYPPLFAPGLFISNCTSTCLAWLQRYLWYRKY